MSGESSAGRGARFTRGNVASRAARGNPYNRVMHVLVAGSSGFIGSALVARLRAEGSRVTRLIRPGRSHAPAGADTRAWSPDSAAGLEPDALDGVDTVVHLGGSSIGTLWTPAGKERIRTSRVRTTALLAGAVARAPSRPALVHASAAGYYGNRGDELLTESSAPGSGFLADVCREWESASRAAEEAGARVVRVRTGLVLSPRGGFLPLMALPFRLGLGGRLGSGRQWMPWIGLEDVVSIYARAVADESWRGVVNAVAPEAVTNGAFTHALARALHRPAWLAVPEAAVGMLPGGMGREMLLVSERIVPKRLQEAGFPFEVPTLARALEPLAR